MALNAIATSLVVPLLVKLLFDEFTELTKGGQENDRLFTLYEDYSKSLSV